jgi:hypothetical protein
MYKEVARIQPNRKLKNVEAGDERCASTLRESSFAELAMDKCLSYNRLSYNDKQHRKRLMHDGMTHGWRERAYG